jgi:hypothetical protein
MRKSTDVLITATLLLVRRVNKIAVSCRINRLTGGENELFCYRVHVNARLWGGLWLALEVLINLLFRVIHSQREHVRLNYLLQRRRHGQAKKGM